MKRVQWTFRALLLCTLLAAACDCARIWVDSLHAVRLRAAVCAPVPEANPFRIVCAVYSDDAPARVFGAARQVGTPPAIADLCAGDRATAALSLACAAPDFTARADEHGAGMRCVRGLH